MLTQLLPPAVFVFIIIVLTLTVIKRNKRR